MFKRNASLKSEQNITAIVLILQNKRPHLKCQVCITERNKKHFGSCLKYLFSFVPNSVCHLLLKFKQNQLHKAELSLTHSATLHVELYIQPLHCPTTLHTAIKYQTRFTLSVSPPPRHFFTTPNFSKHWLLNKKGVGA